MANKQSNPEKTDQTPPVTGQGIEVNTLSPAPSVNTLGQMPDAHTGCAPKDERLRPVAEWKNLKNTKSYMYAAVLAKMAWREGKEVSEGDYTKALASLRGTK